MTLTKYFQTISILDFCLHPPTFENNWQNYYTTSISATPNSSNPCKYILPNNETSEGNGRYASKNTGRRCLRSTTNWVLLILLRSSRYKGVYFLYMDWGCIWQRLQVDFAVMYYLKNRVLNASIFILQWLWRQKKIQEAHAKLLVEDIETNNLSHPST